MLRFNQQRKDANPPQYWLKIGLGGLLLGLVAVGAWLGASAGLFASTPNRATTANPLPAQVSNLTSAPTSLSQLYTSATAPGHLDAVWSVTFSPDSKFLAS